MKKGLLLLALMGSVQAISVQESQKMVLSLYPKGFKSNVIPIDKQNGYFQISDQYGQVYLNVAYAAHAGKVKNLGVTEDITAYTLDWPFSVQFVSKYLKKYCDPKNLPEDISEAIFGKGMNALQKTAYGTYTPIPEKVGSCKLTVFGFPRLPKAGYLIQF